MVCLQHRSELWILKATWPENLKDTREKIRKCKAGEKHGQVISKEKPDESKEEVSGDTKSSHEVGKLEASDGINRNDKFKEHVINVDATIKVHLRFIFFKGLIRIPP